MENNENIRLIKYPYEEYMAKVKDFAIGINKDTLLAFIKPDYKYILTDIGYEPDACEFPITWEDVKESLELEIKLWNLNNSHPGELITFLSEFLNAEVLNEMYKDYIKIKLEKQKKDIDSH